MAEQREPVKRRVALKIIKLGMDSRQIVARFEAERQALAMMDHPNIAKIFDAAFVPPNARKAGFRGGVQWRGSEEEFRRVQRRGSQERFGEAMYNNLKLLRRKI